MLYVNGPSKFFLLKMIDDSDVLGLIKYCKIALTVYI